MPNLWDMSIEPAYLAGPTRSGEDRGGIYQARAGVIFDTDGNAVVHTVDVPLLLDTLLLILLLLQFEASGWGFRLLLERSVRDPPPLGLMSSWRSSPRQPRFACTATFLLPASVAAVLASACKILAECG